MSGATLARFHQFIHCAAGLSISSLTFVCSERIGIECIEKEHLFQLFLKIHAESFDKIVTDGDEEKDHDSARFTLCINLLIKVLELCKPSSRLMLWISDSRWPDKCRFLAHQAGTLFPLNEEVQDVCTVDFFMSTIAKDYTISNICISDPTTTSLIQLEMNVTAFLKHVNHWKEIGNQVTFRVTTNEEREWVLVAEVSDDFLEEKNQQCKYKEYIKNSSTKQTNIQLFDIPKENYAACFNMKALSKLQALKSLADSTITIFFGRESTNPLHVIIAPKSVVHLQRGEICSQEIARLEIIHAAKLLQ